MFLSLYVFYQLSVGILLINNKGLDGLGIGTVLSALLVGRIVAYINKNLKHKIENICFVEAA